MPTRRHTSFLAKIDRWLTAGTRTVIALLLFGMVVEVLCLVVLRYVFHSPPFWGEELARYIMFYLVLLGSAISLRADQHPRLTMVHDALPPVVRAVWGRVVDLLVAGVLLVFLYQGWEMAQDEGIMMTPALRVSYFWVYLAFPVGAVLMLIQLLLRQFRPNEDARPMEEGNIE